jgi:hypothetical protein
LCADQLDDVIPARGNLPWLSEHSENEVGSRLDHDCRDRVGAASGALRCDVVDADDVTHARSAGGNG